MVSALPADEVHAQTQQVAVTQEDAGRVALRAVVVLVAHGGRPVIPEPPALAWLLLAWTPVLCPSVPC